MAVAVDNTGLTAVGTSVTSLTINSFAVGAGSDRLLLVGVSQWKSADTAPIGNFNTSETLTVHDAATIAEAGGTRRATVLRRIAPSNATAAVTVSWSGATCDEAVLGATSWTGVHQTTPLGTAQKASSSSGAPSVTVTASTGDAVHDVVSADDGPGGGTGLTAGQTQRWNVPAASDTTAGAGQSAAGSASVVMSWTYSAGYWAQVGVKIAQTSGGGATFQAAWARNANSVVS